MFLKSMIPHIITLLSVVFAALALRGVTHGMTEMIGLLWISMICDRSDGWIARKLGVTSSHGYYLDALCDVIAFGFVPAYCLLWVMQSHTGLLWWASIAAATLHGIGGIWRLARFLDTSAQYQHSKQTHYIGLPITVSGFLFPVWIRLLSQSESTIIRLSVLGIVIGISWLMVSHVRVPKL